MKSDTRAHRLLRISIAGSCAATSLLVGMGFFAGLKGYAAYQEPSQLDHLGKLAAFGSYLQGSVASLWALAGVFLVAAAFLAQVLQLIRQGEELDDQQAQFALQQDSIRRQAFENTFFELLKLHNDITSQIRTVIKRTNVRCASNEAYGGTRETVHDDVIGRECFQLMYKSFQLQGVPVKVQSHVLNKEKDEQRELVMVKTAYARFYANYQDKLGHYFRSLYHLIKLVKTSTALPTYEDKRRYTSLVRAQLSQFELALIFYNGLSTWGEQCKPLIEEFGLLEHLDSNHLIDSSHKKFYAETAYK